MLAPVGPSMGSLEQHMIRHFPASAKAAYCLPQLYSEALASSQVCALSGLEAARDRLVGLGQELCTMAHATEALRSCNSTCTDPRAVCVQYSCSPASVSRYAGRNALLSHARTATSACGSLTGLLDSSCLVPF
jgi:hypothetical protein